jgi:hypothetical protein
MRICIVGALAGAGDEAVEGAFDAEAAAVEDVGVDHGGGDVAVAKEFLDGADVVAGFEKVGGEGVAEGVGTDRFGKAGREGGLADGALHDGVVKVMATALLGGLVDVLARGREEPLPRPFAGGSRELAFEAVREFNETGAVFDVGAILELYGLQVVSDGVAKGLGKGGDSVFAALAVADANFAAAGVEVFDP